MSLSVAGERAEYSLVNQQVAIPSFLVIGDFAMDLKYVLAVDGVDPKGIEMLTAHGFDVSARPKISKHDLLKEIGNYDVLIVRSATTVTEEVLGAGTNLRLVGRAGVGVDNIDIAAANERGIAVINAPGGNTISACELTCSLILSLARKVLPAATALKAGRWERSLYVGAEVKDKTLAIIGLGRVGREVATRMHAFGMKLVGFDPMVSAEESQRFHVTKMDLDEIWPIADFITLHTPLMDSTKNMINHNVLEVCKKNVKIVNVGRGGLIAESDLLAALNEGKVGGAALDVFEQEPPTDPITVELIKHPSVIATPHLGASTKEAQVRVSTEIAEQIVNMLKPGSYPTPLSEVTKVLQK